MKAIRCDRCHRYYDPYEPDNSTFNSNKLIFAEDDGIGSYYESIQFELCRECMIDAVRFMKEKLPPIKE